MVVLATFTEPSDHMVFYEKLIRMNEFMIKTRTNLEVGSENNVRTNRTKILRKIQFIKSRQ